MAEEKAGKRRIPMTGEGGSPLFTLPSAPGEEPHLIGSRCQSCGEVFFPRRSQCARCFSENLEELLLSTRGKVYSSTVSYIPTREYKGPVPYAVGHVELPERVLIPTLFGGVGTEPVPIGTKVELEIQERGEDDEGNMVMQHTFRPVSK